MKIRFVYFFAVLLILSSCGTDDAYPAGETDLPEFPEIQMTAVSPAAKTLLVCGEEDPSSIALTTEDTLQLSFNMKSYYGIAQYKIDIHGNFDCHAHGRLANTTWQVLTIESTEGTNIDITEKIAVPADAQAGNYHFMLQALDVLGNEAEWVLYSLVVQNAEDRELPEIQILQPSLATVNLSREDTLEVSVQVSDNLDLTGGHLDLLYANEAGTQFTAAQSFFDEAAGLQEQVDYRFKFPASAATGNYTFIIKAYDAAGNLSEANFYVVVSE